MLRLLHPRAGLALAALCTVLSAPRALQAALPLVVSSNEALDGIREYSSITVQKGGRIIVKPIGSGLGFVHLRASSITIEEGGSIDATGAGHQGKDGGDGSQPSGTSGAGKLALGEGEPGSGGGSAGEGGKGTGPTCMLFAAPSGGAAYAMPTLLQLGSAGGAARVADPELPTRGGHGGGRITLEAAVIAVNGEVRADGEDGINPSNIGSGGGAGGVLQILAGSLTGSGVLSARGGRGGAGAQSGGGGGGGVLLLTAPTPASMLSVTTDLQGGQSGSCADAGAGGDGVIVEMTGPACLDVDKDGFEAAACGGSDCDDADASIHPAKDGVSVIERCDGQDNDCSGSADDNVPEAACPGGTCQAGACVPDVTSGGGSEPVGPRPDHIEYVGGCAVHTPSAGSPRTPPFGAELVTLGLSALGLARRRRRAP
jgi:hypothetical protein